MEHVWKSEEWIGGIEPAKLLINESIHRCPECRVQATSMCPPAPPPPQISFFTTLPLIPAKEREEMGNDLVLLANHRGKCLATEERDTKQDGGLPVEQC
jgi:hypothetical protein